MVENPNMGVLQIPPSRSPWGDLWVLECFLHMQDIWNRVDVKVEWEGLFRYSLLEKTTFVMQGLPPCLVDSNSTANLWTQPNSCLFPESGPEKAWKGEKEGQVRSVSDVSGRGRWGPRRESQFKCKCWALSWCPWVWGVRQGQECVGGRWRVGGIQLAAGL